MHSTLLISPGSETPWIENCISHQCVFGRGPLLKEKHVGLGGDNILPIIALSIPTLNTGTEEENKSSGSLSFL